MRRINRPILLVPVVGPKKVTWDTARKGASVALTNADSTANVTSIQSVLATGAAKSTGKWYFELLVGAQTSPYGYVGLALATINTSVDVSTQTSLWWRGLGNSGTGTVGSGFAAGDVLGIGLDMTAMQITGYLNGVLKWTSSPFAADSYLPVVGQAWGGGSTFLFTLRAAAIDQAFSPPVGFLPWA